MSGREFTLSVTYTFDEIAAALNPPGLVPADAKLERHQVATRIPPGGGPLDYENVGITFTWKWTA